MDPSLLMGAGYGIEGLGSLAAGFAQSGALRAQGEYQARMLRLNARLLEFQGQDAIERGDKAADRYNQQISSLIGSQRAAFAGQGVVVGDGSAAEVSRDTAQIGAEDALMIRSNAWREAWGYRVQAEDLRSQARIAKIGANFQASQSILTGINQAAGSGFKAASQFMKVQSSSGSTGNLLEQPKLGDSMRADQGARQIGLGGYDLGYRKATGYQPVFSF